MSLILMFKNIKPLSVNNVYAGYPRRHKTDRAKAFTKEIIFETQKQLLDIKKSINLKHFFREGERFNVKISVFGKWINKNKTISKKDIANVEKPLIDALFKGIQLFTRTADDSQIFNIQLEKIPYDKDHIVVEFTPFEYDSKNVYRLIQLITKH